MEKHLDLLKQRFLDKINLRIQSNLDRMQTLIVVDWHFDDIHKFVAVSITDLEKVNNQALEERLINEFSNALARQAVAPTAKTKSGRFIVKLVCKYF